MVRAPRLAAFAPPAPLPPALAATPHGDGGTPAPRQGLALAQMDIGNRCEEEAPRGVTASDRQGALTAARADVEAESAKLRELALLGTTEPRMKGECGGCAWGSCVGFLRFVAIGPDLRAGRASAWWLLCRQTTRISAGPPEGPIFAAAPIFFAHRAWNTYGKLPVCCASSTRASSASSASPSGRALPRRCGSGATKTEALIVCVGDEHAAVAFVRCLLEECQVGAFKSSRKTSIGCAKVCGVQGGRPGVLAYSTSPWATRNFAATVLLSADESGVKVTIYV